ncbi:(2Fe-2S)-binding protein [Janthinobacterium psychrotolerans]|uniref:Bacterioferritin-associated ferredoxin n=1 Tax=Janthinobacterium psychrotolerans TaxID=1747903 RepID=A0A1A7C5G8_9BURK|nr:(2Fe-2S)-binding protein [Janthinobacterium psychrotolerans]OBV40284.1 bacterioferritin-associated ferredoxin [Janthinobacterium psychrotolerans]
MIVCVCNNISDREIRQAVDLGLSTMAELRRDLGVATCCGKCHTCAREVLSTHLDATAALRETVISRTEAPVFTN